MTYLGLRFPLPLRDGFSNEVEVFFVEEFFLFAVGPTALLLPAALFQVVVFLFLLIFIDNKAFSDLQFN